MHGIVVHRFGTLKPLEVAMILESITPNELIAPYNVMVISCYNTMIGSGCGVYLLHGWNGCLTFRDLERSST